jgi:hypothetical protein
MSVIKYTAKFKRILTITGTENGRQVTIRVGEVTSFQQNTDGTIDLVAWIWPQTSQRIREQIEKNPGIMGMTAETIPVTDHVLLPDSAREA